MEPVGRDAVEFFRTAAKRGFMNSNTAGSHRAAIREVMSAVEPEKWESVNLHEIDLDDYATRFERLKMTKFKPNSLQVYKSRFKNGVGMYLEYLGSPSTWRYKAERPAKERGKTKRAETTVPATLTSNREGGDSKPPTIKYPYPLRAELLITLELPPDLTKREAQRLTTFISSLAIDEQPALSTGAQT